MILLVNGVSSIDDATTLLVQASHAVSMLKQFNRPSTLTVYIRTGSKQHDLKQDVHASR